MLERALFLLGAGMLLASPVAAGAAGGVCGGANLMPAVYSRLYSAAGRRDELEIQHWKRTIADIFSSVYQDDEGRMTLIPALKTAMEECGLCQSIVAPPLSAVGNDHARRIRDSLPRLLAACEYAAVAE